MHFATFAATTARLAGLAAASPWAGRPSSKPTSPIPSHVNNAPYGGPDTYFEGYPGHANVTRASPGHVNTAPYGNADTFFEGLEEAKNGTLHARTSYAGVYYCDQDTWKGPCRYTIASGGLCHPWNTQWEGSFGPDHGIACTLWAGPLCGPTARASQLANGGVSRGIEYPGATFLQNIAPGLVPGQPNSWTPKSFNCHWV